MSRYLIFAALIAAGALWGGFRIVPADAALKLESLETPAAAGSSVPRVSAGKDGLLYLSWVEPIKGISSEDGQAFRFCTWKAGNWSTVKTISTGPQILAAVSSEPGILELGDGTLVAQWLTKAQVNESNHIDVAVSRNGGTTWSKPVKPYRDTTPGEHMYVSLFPWPAGGAGIAWLDPRGGKKTALIQTTIANNGELGPEHFIDADVCTCCPTSSALTSVGPLLLYRGRTTDDIRDMHVTAYQENRWSLATTVHADGWKLNGCPTTRALSLLVERKSRQHGLRRHKEGNGCRSAFRTMLGRASLSRSF